VAATLLAAPEIGLPKTVGVCHVKHQLGTSGLKAAALQNSESIQQQHVAIQSGSDLLMSSLSSTNLGPVAGAAQQPTSKERSRLVSKRYIS
jgi:hypothetical protein